MSTCEKPLQYENSNSTAHCKCPFLPNLLFGLGHVLGLNWADFGPEANGGSKGEQTSGDSRARRLNLSQRVTFQVLLSQPEHSSHVSRWKPWQREIRAGIPQLPPKPLPYRRSLPLLSSIMAVRTEVTWAGSTPPEVHPWPLLTVTGLTGVCSVDVTHLRYGLEHYLPSFPWRPLGEGC